MGQQNSIKIRYGEQEPTPIEIYDDSPLTINYLIKTFAIPQQQAQSLFLAKEDPKKNPITWLRVLPRQDGTFRIHDRRKIYRVMSY